MENLGRGVVALPTDSDTVFVSWRLLGYEPQDLAFNVYRSTGGAAPVKLNPDPLTEGTNFIDTGVDLTSENSYTVSSVVDGVELTPSEPFVVAANSGVQPYLSLPLQDAGDRHVHVVWVGDLDGNGEYDYIVSRMQNKASDSSLLEAYLADGTFLWRMDFGENSKDRTNIEPGSAAVNVGHADGITVFDMDGDGKSEVITIGADGVIFADGEMITEADDDRQFVSVLDGMTGDELARAPVPDDYLVDGSLTMHFGIAYLDGVNPSFVLKGKNRIGSGDFNLLVAAYDYDGTNFTERWSFIPGPREDVYPNFHQIRIVDVDGDGRDEICDGGYVLDDDGSVLYTLSEQGVVHGDRFHIGDLDPDRPGLEGFGIQQNNSSGLLYYYYDAGTGEILRGHYGGIEDAGRGVAADVYPDARGYEYWSFHGIHNVQTGDVLSPEPYRPWPNMRVWWDGDVLGENMNKEVVNKWNPETGGEDRLLTAYRQGAVYTTRDVPTFYGDILGDWREEIIFEMNDQSRLMIYTSTIPSDTRLYTLAHNPEYRQCFTVKGYQQSHMVDYYLGEGMATPPMPNILPIVTAESDAPAIASIMDDNGFLDTDRITNDATPSLIGIAPPNVSVIVSRVGIGDDATVSSDADGFWSYDYPTDLADGVYHFVARIDDGNNIYSYPCKLTISTVAPLDPALGAIVSNAEGGYTAFGNATPGLWVEVEIDGVGSVGVAEVGGDGVWSITSDASLPDGVVGFSVTAMDIAGNLSNPVSRNVDASVAAPSLVSIDVDTGASSSDFVTNDNSISFQGTASAGETVQVFKIGQGSLGSATADASGNWSFDYSAVELADGEHNFTAYIGSSLGAEPLKVTVDTAAPEVVSIVQTDPEVDTSPAVRVTFQVTYDGEVSGVDSADFELEFTGGLTGAISNVSTVDGLVYDVQLEGLAGPGTVMLKQIASGTGIEDVSGNVLDSGYDGPVFTRVLLGDGQWSNLSTLGRWENNSNWVDGIVAEGESAVADFASLDLLADNTVVMDQDQTVVELLFGDTDPATPASWTLSGEGSLSLVGELGETSKIVSDLPAGERANIEVPMSSGFVVEKKGPGEVAISAPVTISDRFYVRDGTLRFLEGAVTDTKDMDVSSATSGVRGTLAVDGGEVNASGATDIYSGAKIEINGGIANFQWIRLMNNTGGLVQVNGGVFNTESIQMSRSGGSGINFNNNGFITTGGVSNLSYMLLGTANSTGNMSVEGGEVNLSRHIVLGQQNTSGRGGNLRVINDGLLTILDTDDEGGLILNGKSKNAATASFYDGTSYIEEVTFGKSDQITSGIGTFLISGGDVYLGAGGIQRRGVDEYVSEVILESGLLGATASWSTELAIDLPEGGNITIAPDAIEEAPVVIGLAGEISGLGGFTKSGAGTLVLSGDNTFSGAVVIEGGMLQVDGSLGAGEPILLRNGSVSGEGTIERAIALDTEVLVGDDYSGVVGIHSLTWNSGQTLSISYGDGVSDTLTLAGALLKSGEGPFEVALNGSGAGTFTIAEFGSTDFEATDFVATGLPANTFASFAMVESSLTVTIEVVEVTIEISNLSFNYDGLPKQAEVTVDPAELTVVVTYDGSTELPTYPGTYEVVATVDGGGYYAQETAELTIGITALVKYPPSLEGEIDGSMQVLEAQDVLFERGSGVYGDLLVPGTPIVSVDRKAVFGGLLDGDGSIEPSDHEVVLERYSVLRYLIQHVDPIEMPELDPVSEPEGTRDLSLRFGRRHRRGINWSEVRDLSLNYYLTPVLVPAGVYGDFEVNGLGTLVLGVSDSSEPSVYEFQSLELHGLASVRLEGPVIIRVAGDVETDYVFGTPSQPEWLHLEIVEGDLEMEHLAQLSGTVIVPSGEVELGGRSRLVGRLISNELSIDKHSELVDPVNFTPDVVRHWMRVYFGH